MDQAEEKEKKMRKMKKNVKLLLVALVVLAIEKLTETLSALLSGSGEAGGERVEIEEKVKVDSVVGTITESLPSGSTSGTGGDEKECLCNSSGQGS